MSKTSRRQFLQQTLSASSSTLLSTSINQKEITNIVSPVIEIDKNPFQLDLSPAKWIWFPNCIMGSVTERGL